MHRLYRKLNGMTIKDNHPLPRIDDQIDRLQGGTYFTTLDFKAGYYDLNFAVNRKGENVLEHSRTGSRTPTSGTGRVNSARGGENI
jgi:hypothetical protein